MEEKESEHSTEFRYHFRPFGKSYWAAVIAFLGIFVSVYSAKAFDSTTQSPDIFYLGYAGVCITLFFLIWAREKVVGQEAEASKKDYQKKQAELISILQNFPPVHTLESFSRSYKEVKKLKRLYDDDTEATLSESEWQENVRRCLSALVILFKQFNHTADSANYSINVMFYVEKETYERYLTSEEQKEIEDKIRFIEDPRDPWHNLEAVLSLDPALSCCSKNISDFEPDPELKPIALPVIDRRLEPTNHRSKYIPVAPMAIKHDTIFVEDTRVFAEESAYKDYEIYPELRDRLIKYFKEEGSKRVGSILSVRLDYPVSYDEDTTLGVLNIHSNRPNVQMKDESMISAYLMMARPMIEHLKDLLIGTTIVYDIDDEPTEGEEAS